MAAKTRAPLTASQQRELENIRASWAAEGQHVTESEMALLARVATGELDFETAYALMAEQDSPAIP